MEKRGKQLVMKANSVHPPVPHESEESTPANGRPPRIRTASKKQFEQAQRKTNKLHAGLFRRLAK